MQALTVRDSPPSVKHWDVAGFTGWSGRPARTDWGPRGGRSEAELVRDAAHGFDAKGDVLIQGNAQFLGAFDDILAAYGAGEGFVFHPFAHGFGLEGGDPVRPHQGAGRDESGKLVTREKDFG